MSDEYIKKIGDNLVSIGYTPDVKPRGNGDNDVYIINCRLVTNVNGEKRLSMVSLGYTHYLDTARKVIQQESYVEGDLYQVSHEKYSTSSELKSILERYDLYIHRNEFIEYGDTEYSYLSTEMIMSEHKSRMNHVGNMSYIQELVHGLSFTLLMCKEVTRYYSCTDMAYEVNSSMTRLIMLCTLLDNVDKMDTVRILKVMKKSGIMKDSPIEDIRDIDWVDIFHRGAVYRRMVGNIFAKWKGDF